MEMCRRARFTTGAVAGSLGLWIVASLFLLVSAYYTTEQYCSTCSDHTMCLYQGVSQACQQGQLIRGVTPDQQTACLNAHNRLRNLVAQGQESRGAPGPQPPASNMNRLFWNNDLADVAQRWADQCTFQHDACRNLPNMYVGQNLYLQMLYNDGSTSLTPNWDQAVQGWYDEVAQFSNSYVNNYQFSEATGHYTQLVWADTYLVGCGYTCYQDGGWYKQYYVCNYGPGGNIIGSPMYDVGPAATQCSVNLGSRNAAYPGLC